MIKINLLPRKHRKKPLKIDLYIFLVVLVISVVAAGFIYYQNDRDITNSQNQIESAKKEIANLEGIYKDYLRMESEKKEIAARIKTIDSLKEGRALSARILYDLTSLIKESVWLRTFKKDEDRFEMEGRSLQNESISELIERLSGIPYMKNVELRNVEDVAEGGITVKKFVIYGNIAK
jgi:Tfp pilus assembly protein PilN